MATTIQPGPISPDEARIPVDVFDVHVGGIVWIRRRNDVDQKFVNGLPLDPGSYNHPAVVIRKKKQENDETLVTIAPMTSFGTREMTVSHPHDRSMWMRYLPLAPSPPHPMSGIQLVLKNGAVLEKPSYIQRVCYEVSPEILAHYTRGADYLKRSKALKLTDGSLKQLLLHMPSPVPWVPAPLLPQPPLSIEPNPGDLLPVEKSASHSTHASAEPAASPAPTGSFCDIKIAMSSSALDDGTFDRLLRLLGVANIEVTVTPAQTSVASPGSFSPTSEQQIDSSFSHPTTSAQETSFSRQTKSPAMPLMTAFRGAWLIAVSYQKYVALYGAIPLLVCIAISLIKRRPTMTHLTIVKILKLGFKIICRAG